ncbi:MAG: helix-turn-helix transcriptional regulator [Prevotellaceae bacterium]|nr:helix-turn-helix transcriptional regulator [Prevotellaceae bacterium]
MKDRIRKIMETQEMSQKQFSEYLNISPASLSSIFTEKTKPTLATVSAIVEKFPEISLDWLITGQGRMYKEESTEAQTRAGMNLPTPKTQTGGMKDLFSEIDEVVPKTQSMIEADKRASVFVPKREIKEIRIFFDDGTYETFTSSK